nr:hypothetical protein [Tanacetum cinerariifolium]
MKPVKETVKIQAVSKRPDIDASSGFMLTYNSDNDIVEVCDDLKVNEFMEFVVKSSRIVTLCIVESSVHGRQLSTTGSNQQSNFVHATPSVNVFQTEYHATQIHQTQMHVFPCSGFYQNLSGYQQMHGFPENPMYVPRFSGYPMQDPQSDSTNHKRKQVVGSPKTKKPNELDLLGDEKLRPFEKKVMGSVFGKVKRLPGEDESSESDDESSESDEEVAMDGNNQIPPLAYGGRCFRHLLMNLREKCPRFISKEELFWKACKGYRISDFEEHFSTLRNLLPSVANKLDMICLEKWARVHFPEMVPEVIHVVCKFSPWEFLTKLKECIIGKQDHLTIISDGAVSIALAIKNVFLNAFHGRCCRHLLLNLHEKCPRFISKEELFWKACKSYRISDFEERFSTLRDWLPRVANKLDTIGLEKWAKVHFSDEHKHELAPWAEDKLAKRIAKSASWTVRPAANYLYNIVDYYKNATVDMNTRTCSCGQCVWRASYNEVIYDVGHPSEWEQPYDLITVLPPVMEKRQPERPRNRDRFRSKGEQITPKSCTQCFKGEHNRRDCPSVVPSQIFIPTTSSWNEE